MKGITLEKAARLCKGTLVGADAPERELGQVVIDSRLIQAGDLFVAFKGERVDGHDFIARALEAGAGCCLTERLPEGVTGPCILVDDVQTALEEIAAGYRETLSLPILGITGSVGKTSAKECVSSVLSQRLKVLKTEGNLNNQIGVPMTLSRIGPEHQAAVVEMGINGFGQMRQLARMVRPTIGLFTVIGHAHLEFLHDLDGVLQAKTEMLEFLPPDGLVILNGDDPLLRRYPCSIKKMYFGLSEGCQVRALDVKTDPEGRSSCTIWYQQRGFRVSIPAFGKHMIYAALEGAAAGFALGLSDEEIIAGIEAYEPVGRRSAVTDTGKVLLIDDCYNANPDSVKSGIDSMAALGRRRVCILGDMLELGDLAPELHREIGRYAEEKGVELVLSCGQFGDEIVSGAGASGRVFDTAEQLIAALPGLLQPGDAVLVKASRGARFERISEAIKAM